MYAVLWYIAVVAAPSANLESRSIILAFYNSLALPRAWRARQGRDLPFPQCGKSCAQSLWLPGSQVADNGDDIIFNALFFTPCGAVYVFFCCHRH